MPLEDDRCAVISARDSLSGWLEGKIVKSVTIEKVKQFILEDIISRHRIPAEIVVDIGPENRGDLTRFLTAQGIARVDISLYYPGSNSPVERSIRTLKDALSKMTDGYREDPGTR